MDKHSLKKETHIYEMGDFIDGAFFNEEHVNARYEKLKDKYHLTEEDQKEMEILEKARSLYRNRKALIKFAKSK